jgi:Kdo2-lipid IVA lauroyltransferase/acyltransferase
MDVILLWIVRASAAALMILSHNRRLALIAGVLRVFVYLQPRHERIARENLQRAFPNQDAEWYEDILKRSYRELARVIVDVVRLPTLDRKWVEGHVEHPFLPRLQEIHRTHTKSGTVYASGHLGSFEILAHAMTLYDRPMSFLVRHFKMPRVDRWWNARREANGNTIISRDGGVREALRTLQQGRDVGILFDQNVTRDHAVFVDFFGLPAATTRTVGVAALRTKAPVVVVSITHYGEDRYRINMVECEVSSIYADKNLSAEEKVARITQLVSTEYEKMIRNDPAAWFWMHRRWRTRPEAGAEREGAGS